MAKSNNKKTVARKAAPAKAAPARKTEVRNTSRPRVATTKEAVAVKPLEITHAMIAERAYHIHLSGHGGSEQDNWCRAERELRGL